MASTKIGLLTSCFNCVSNNYAKLVLLPFAKKGQLIINQITTTCDLIVFMVKKKCVGMLKQMSDNKANDIVGTVMLRNHTQPAPVPVIESVCKAVVFEGGGVAGVAHAGVLKVLDVQGKLKEVTHWGGSSAGSIAAAACACGLTTEQIQDVLVNTDFEKFKDDSPGYIIDTWRLLNDFGWYKGDALEEWFGDVLEKYVGDRNITLKKLFETKGSFLLITVTDINMGTTVYMTHESHPDMKIKTAVRRSASIPIIFKADKEKLPTMVLDEKTGNVVEKQIDHYFVDGGILDNYPIKEMYKYVGKENVIGIKLMSSLEIGKLHNPYISDVPNPPQNIFSYVMLLISMLRSNSLKMHIDDEDWERTIKVDVKDVSSTNFDITEKDRQFLLQQGTLAANNFLSLHF